MEPSTKTDNLSVFKSATVADLEIVGFQIRQTDDFKSFKLEHLKTDNLSGFMATSNENNPRQQVPQ